MSISHGPQGFAGKNSNGHKITKQPPNLQEAENLGNIRFAPPPDIINEPFGAPSPPTISLQLKDPSETSDINHEQKNELERILLQFPSAESNASLTTFLEQIKKENKRIPGNQLQELAQGTWKEYFECIIKDVAIDELERLGLASIAADHGQLDILELLKAKGVNLNSQGDQPFTPIEIAVYNHDPKTVSKLIELGVIPTHELKETLLNYSKKAMCLPVIELLSGNDSLEVFSTELLTEMTGDKSKQESCLSEKLQTAYRFSPMKDVNELCKELSNACRQKPEILADVDFVIGASEASFLKWGGQIARLMRREDINQVHTVYTDQIVHEFIPEDIARKDRDYGMTRYEQVKSLSTLTPNAEIIEQFTKSVSKESKPDTMLSFISRIADAQYDHATTRGDTSRDDYITVRNRRDGYTFTPLVGRYQWTMDKVREISQTETEDKINHQALGSYSILIPEQLRQDPRQLEPEDLETAYYSPNRIDHGLLPLNEYWPKIESIQKELLELDFDKTDSDSLKSFYTKVSEMCWLFGQATPTKRGTGSYIEKWLLYIHLLKGIDPPILTADSPQLDCLDIIYPYSLYKKNFLSFFQKESLPENCPHSLM